MASLLNSIASKFNPLKPDEFWMSELEKEIIQSVIQKNEQALNKSLVQRIKQYRKAPVGYSTLIDVFSIAIIKFAHLQNMACDINVIEIPPFFFNENECKIDILSTQVPFFNEARIALKDYGIELKL